LRRITTGALITGIVLTVALVATQTARDHLLSTYEVAIVTTDDPRLHQGPSAHAAEVEPTPVPGLMVRVEETRREWTQIRMGDGTTGWLPTKTLTRL
ncbi:MAG: SH3 domain-containing protein, partial [Bradymonadaceae bacterium]